MHEINLHVKTPVFEGPLDLLLELIESRKLLINDISLAAVTDDYIAKLQALPQLPLRDASEFVALAATLLLIKSRSLLPTLTLSQEESQDIKELQMRLAMYQIIKEGGRALYGALQSPYLWEGETTQPDPIFLPDPKATQETLHRAIVRVIEEFPTAAELPKVDVKKAISLEEAIEKLAGRISSAIRLSFKEFSGHGKNQQEKRNIVVSFLALLELVKRGIITATQSKEFGDIILQHDSVAIPTYE